MYSETNASKKYPLHYLEIFFAENKIYFEVQAATWAMYKRENNTVPLYH